METTGNAGLTVKFLCNLIPGHTINKWLIQDLKSNLSGSKTNTFSSMPNEKKSKSGESREKSRLRTPI